MHQEVEYLPVYFLILSATYSCMLIYLYRRAIKFRLNVLHTLNLALIFMVTGFLGGRLFHVLLEFPDVYYNDLNLFFRFWQGGFVFYGGFIGVLVACSVYFKLKKVAAGSYLDLFTPVIALGYALGRLSCLYAGCCYGKVCDLPWMPSRYPTQIFATIWELILWLGLLKIEKRKLPAGFLFLIWLFFHGIGRIIMEALRDDYRGPQILGLSFSTFFSILLVFISALLLKKKFNKIPTN